MRMTMTLAEFRKITKDLPEETVIFVDPGNVELTEVNCHGILPATDTQPPLIWLDMGQAWTYEVDGYARIDAWLAK